MRIKEYQQGGGLIYTPFIPESGATRDVSSSASTSAESKIDPLDKEILTLMKDANLLPSDINMIYNQLVSFQRRASRLSALGGANPYGSAMPGMLQIQHMVSLAKNNKENWDASVKSIKEHDAGSEIALDSYGRMWVRNHDDGGLELINPGQYDKSKHTPVSYSQLMFFRRSEPEMAFSSMPFEELGEYVVGMKDARTAIQAIIDKFGTIKSDSFEAQEISNLAKKVSELGYFKVTDERTRSIASPETLNHFTNLVWDYLDSNIQHLLTARAAISPSGPQDPRMLLHNLIFANSDQSTTQSFDASLSKASGGAGAKDSSDPLRENNYLQQLGLLRLTKSRTQIVPKSSQVWESGGLEVTVYQAGMPVDHSMKGLSMMPFDAFRKEAEGLKAADTSSVTFGNRILDPTEYDKIVYDGASELNIAMMPYTRDPKSGQLIPDFDKLKAFNQIQKWKNDHRGASSYELQNYIKEELHYDPVALGYDPETNECKLDTMPFIVFSAYASKDVLDIDSNMKPYLEKLDKGLAKDLLVKYNNSVQYGGPNPSKSSKKKNKYDDSERWDMYKGNVYIPMTDAGRALLLSGIGEYFPKSDYTDYARKTMGLGIAREAKDMVQQTEDYDEISNLGQW